MLNTTIKLNKQKTAFDQAATTCCNAVI